MIIKCKHGYFQFQEEEPGEISKFNALYGLELEPYKGFFTYPFLIDAESYSLIGKPYLNLPAIKTFEGEPSEVMRENGFVFSLELGLLVPIASVVSVVNLQVSDIYYSSTGLIQPGSWLQNNEKVSDYTAWYSFRTQSFKYTEIQFL